MWSKGLCTLNHPTDCVLSCAVGMDANSLYDFQIVGKICFRNCLGGGVVISLNCENSQYYLMQAVSGQPIPFERVKLGACTCQSVSGKVVKILFFGPPVRFIQTFACWSETFQKSSYFIGRLNFRLQFRRKSGKVSVTETWDGEETKTSTAEPTRVKLESWPVSVNKFPL